jgi:tetratricopeptide (TPR) repeat protein
MARSSFCAWLIAVLAAAGCSSLSKDNSPYNNRVAEQQRGRANGYLELGEYAAAAAVLDSLSKTRPTDPAIFELLGDAERDAKHTDKAIKAYEQAVRLNYGAYSPHMKLGTLLMENGKTGRALTEFELAVKASDHDVLARYNYGVALHETGRHDEALEQWRIAAGIAPEDERTAEALAMGLAEAGDSSAITQFKRAHALGADDASFHNNYALALDNAGRSDEAEAHFRLAVEKASPAKHDEYQRNFALHELRAGHNEEAQHMFSILVAGGGGLWSDTVYLARANLALKDYDHAIEVLEPFALDVESGKVPPSSPRIDRMPPTLDDALDILGRSWRGKGDKQRAIEYLKRAVALKPDDVTHLNNYGVVLAEGGMLPDARKQWYRVLEIEPQNATAKANLSAFGR